MAETETKYALLLAKAQEHTSDIYYTLADIHTPEDFADSEKFWIENGYVPVKHVEIPFTPPMRALVVDAAVRDLRRKKESTLADAQAKATEIERKIQKFLAIEGPAGSAE